MWLCTDWAYDAEAVAAWGTWAAVVVALGIALASTVSRFFQRRVDAQLLAQLLYHEVVHASVVLESVKGLLVPEDDSGIVEVVIAGEPTLQREIAFHIGRIQLPALASSANRLSVLPKKVALSVGELQSDISFLRYGGEALATEGEPPSDFYPALCDDLRACVRSAQQTRGLLFALAFPNDITRDVHAEHVKAQQAQKCPKVLPEAIVK